MTPQIQFTSPNENVSQVPALAQTRSGVFFDPSADWWRFRDGLTEVSMNFKKCGLYVSALEYGFKMTLIYYLKNLSVAHALNMFKRSNHLFLILNKEFGSPPDEISDLHLINYCASTKVLSDGYLSALAGFLKQWYALGYPGVSKTAVDYLNSVRLKGNAKGGPVLTMCPIAGPLTNMETEAVLDALTSAFQEQRISTADYLLAWLIIAIGMRPVQYAALKVCDFSVHKDMNGRDSYVLAIPCAKKRNVANIRMFKTDRLIHAEVAKLIQMYIKTVKQALKDVHPNIEEAPLFPAKSMQGEAKGYEFHSSSKILGLGLTTVLEKLNVFSHRTGQPIQLNATRFRRTIGTRAAEDGHGPLVIAELLGHQDIQNVGVYIEATPAIVDRIDRAIAIQMAPLAQAFAGKLIKNELEALRGNDHSSRILDLRIDRTGQAMGSCGQFSYCGFNAPIACYRCACFQPWLDGPHEAVLAYLLDKREKLLISTDQRLATVNDLTILAVAEVVRLCAESNISKLGDRNG